MADLKLYYFPVRALGEGARMLFAYAGREFEDIRIPSEQWQAFKPSTPLGQMPVLEISGQKYAQSLAIARYLGREFGLVGKNSQEDLEIDQNVYFVNDIREAANFVFYVKDDNAKAALRKELNESYIHGVLKKLNDIILKNNGHLALGRLTWADFWFAGVYDRFKLIIELPDIDQKYPALQKVRENVLSNPKVKAYHVKSAPKSIY